MAIFLERSIAEGTSWTVFEPTDEPLWSGLWRSIGALLTETSILDDDGRVHIGQMERPEAALASRRRALPVEDQPSGARRRGASTLSGLLGQSTAFRGDGVS